VAEFRGKPGRPPVGGAFPVAGRASWSWDGHESSAVDRVLASSHYRMCFTCEQSAGTRSKSSGGRPPDGSRSKPALNGLGTRAAR
jgi:hypothetical protein